MYIYQKVGRSITRCNPLRAPKGRSYLTDNMIFFFMKKIQREDPPTNIPGD